MAEDVLISFKGVSKNFGKFNALDNVSLDIHRGEFFALLGPSGCGKTTLMRMLAGFDNPSEGNIFLEGKDLTGVPPNKRPVNMMFQSYALFPHLNIYDNIAFGLRRDKLSKSKIADRVEKMLDLVQLTKFVDRKPYQISGGQKQRVALARALARNPKVLLLDEPLAALDKKLRQKTQFELVDIQEKIGTTFLIVTHDQEEAMTVATRMAIMDNGKLVQVAAPAEVYEYPNSSYVAGFIGDINLLQGNISSKKGNQYTVSWSEGNDDLVISVPPKGRAVNFKKNDSCFFAIRPEKINISADRSDGYANNVKGKIIDIAYLGNISIYHIQVTKTLTIKVCSSNVRRLSRRNFTWNDSVWLAWTDTAGLLLEK